MKRRTFLKGCAGFAAMAAARGFGITNLLYSKDLSSQPPPDAANGVNTPPLNGRDLLVFVFVRGGMDGLNVVIPFNTSAKDRAAYYTNLRATLNIPAPDSSASRKSIGLDEAGIGTRFALHPDAARGTAGVNTPNPQPSDSGGLFKLFADGEMAIVHACGSPDVTGSHFDTQKFVDSAGKYYNSGWITRYLQAMGMPSSALVMSPQPAVPQSLGEWYSALAIDNVSNFGSVWNLGHGYNSAIVSAQRGLLEPMFNRGSDFVELQGQTAFTAYDDLHSILSSSYSPSAVYASGNPFDLDNGGLSQSLQTIARLAKASLPTNPLRIACVDVGGPWDTHDNEGTIDWSGNTRFPSLIGMLSNNLKAFHDDLQADPAMQGRFTVVVLSEFGRVLYQNNSAGCDHGSGNCMFVIGSKNSAGASNVNGGKVYCNWPGLQNMGFNDGLQITTDYRLVLADILYNRMGATASQINTAIFPGLGFSGGLGYTHASVTGILENV